MTKFNEGVWDDDPKIMRYEPRPYVCTNCGHRQNIGTNHTGNVHDYCKGCSWKPSFGKGVKIPQLGGSTYREFRYAGEVNEKTNTMKRSKFKKLIESIVREFDKFDVVHTNEVGQHREDIVGSAHGNVGGTPVKSERDPLNDPLLKEYNNPETRKKALISRPNDALKLIYIWSKKEMIDYREFEELINQWAADTDSSQFGAS